MTYLPAESIRRSPTGALGEVQLTDAIEGLISSTACNGYQFPGDHFDVGVPVGMLKASIHTALNNKDIAADLREWLVKVL